MKRYYFMRAALAPFFCSIFLIMPAAHSADIPPSVMQAIEKLSPEGGARSRVERSIIPGFYTVNINGQPVHITDDGAYVLVGQAFNLSGDNVRIANRSNDAAEKIVARVNDKVVSYVPPNKRYRVVVFTDVNCGYCRRFHRHMPELMELGVQVDYLLVPYIGKTAHRKAVSVWCAADQNKAMDVAKAGRDVPEANCAHPIEQNLKIAKQLNVTGTPQIFLENGHSIAGYVKPQDLLTAIARQNIQPDQSL